MPRLAKAATDMRAEYDAVVIGSGYGGGVAASRLARAGLKVCVLERGREILPGEFPDKLLAAQRELQISGKKRSFGSKTALFDMRFGEGVHALLGCGLGGTSLINANVCLVPSPKVLADLAWPAPIRCDHWLNVGFHRAKEMLRPVQMPPEMRPLKFKALQKAANAMQMTATPIPLHIAFEDGVTAAGVAQPACTACGDCMGGCNYGAKTTVHSTYLADAVNHGADIFTEQTVRFVERSGETDGQAPGRWRVVLAPSETEGAVVKRKIVSAATVVLAAGTLGSAEIMMRSRARGLNVSDMLGKRLSTNADTISFGYNNDEKINGIGTGRRPRRDMPKVGPAVSGLIDLRRQSGPVDEQMVIVEGSIPSAMAPLMPLLLSTGSATSGTDMDQGIKDALEETGRTLESLIFGAYTGAVANTQTFLAVSHDSGRGNIIFERDRAMINWPGAGWEPVFQRIEAALKDIVKATGGTYVPNPASAALLGGNLMTVHPLGGCIMGEDSLSGVVDHSCRVFDSGDAGDTRAVHEGLYICDGSVIPRPVGVHPLLTITAVAERAMLLMARSKGLPLSAEHQRAPPRRDFVALKYVAAPAAEKAGKTATSGASG